MIRLAIYLMCMIPLVSLGFTFIMPEQEKNDSIDSHHWKHRLVVISGSEESVIEQRTRFLELEDHVLDRDLLILTIIHPTNDETQDPNVPDPDSLAAHLGIDSSRFQVLLVGKDGEVKEHRFEQVKPQEFFSCIDVMPMRLAEMKQRNAT